MLLQQQSTESDRSLGEAEGGDTFQQEGGGGDAYGYGNDEYLDAEEVSFSSESSVSDSNGSDISDEDSQVDDIPQSDRDSENLTA